MRDPNGAVQLTLDGLKLALWVPWALVWGTLGLGLIFLIVTFPLGLACWSIAAWPLARMVNTRNTRQVEWQERQFDNALRESTTAGGIPPWLLDDEEWED